MTSTVQNPSHTFKTAGLYKVTLTVTRGTDTDSSTQTLNVGGVPQVDFVGNPRSVSTGDLVQFTDTSLNSPTSWAWNFGDTATSTIAESQPFIPGKGYLYGYPHSTEYQRDGTETKNGYINVGIPPTADFIPVIAPYVMGKVPMSVNFIDKSTGLPTSWNWDFGDGSTSADQNPSHVYQTKGIYTVSLTVKNNFGTDTMVKKGIISVGNGGAADFSASATTVGVGWVVSFTDLSTFAPTQWNWDFGDGITGSGPKPDHTYHKTGVYDVSLTASSPYITDSVTKKQYITVLNIPRADFVADKTRGGAPMAVTFTDKSSNGPTSWKWDFGDGATSTDQNPSHTYTTLGSYTVTLTASNVNGQDSTTKINYIITTLAPVAAFSADRRIGNAPFLVQFTDLSSNNPTSWKWNFGDSATSTEQNPRHIYQAEGSYNVSLTVTNQYGSDTSYKSGISAPTITAAPTTVSVTAAPTTAATVVATTIPMTTQAPMPAAVSVVASVIAVLAIVSAKRK